MARPDERAHSRRRQDRMTRSGAVTRLREEAALLVTACRFLTRLPLPDRPVATTARLASAVRYYPAVGLLVGGAAALLLLVLAPLMGPVVAVLLAITATAALTGAMHEDGLADTCDGLGGATAARTLEIMRDSRVGTFGLIGLGLTLALKVAALAALPLAVAAAALVAAHAASRLACVATISLSAYARPGGTAGFTRRRISGRGLAVAVATAALALACFGAVAGWSAAVAATLGIAAGAALVRRVADRRLGGYTGDTLGACQQLAELGFYLAVLAWF